MKALNVAGALVSPIGITRNSNEPYQVAKGCLPLMASGDASIVVASPQVELGVDLGTAELVKEIGDKWDRVPILPGELV